MGSEIQQFTIDELVKTGVLEKPLDGNHGGIHPKGDDFIENGIPFIMASDMVNGGVDTVNCKFISPAQAATLRKGFSKTGDVLLSHKATIGRTAIVGKIETDYVMLTPQVTYYRVKDWEKLNNRYLKYYFNSQEFQSLLNQWAGGGSTRAYLGITGQLKLPIKMPDIKCQESIAHILGSLDDKIELNRQMNATLEAMAQALFKSWFVDFDPVIDNALAAGNPIPEPLHARAETRKALGDKRKPLPEAIQKQFPSRFVFSEEMGWIPEGWEVGHFRDISKHVKDGVKAEDVADYDFYVGLEHIGRKQIFLAENGAGESIESNKSGFEENDLLFGKLRPYFHKVCIVPKDGICSTDILVFRPGSPEYRSYMYLIAYTEAFVENANMHSTGTRMPRASAKDMLEYVIAIPSEAVLKSFETMTAPFWGKGMEAVGCSRTLARLRDTLLPRLLSGQLRIPDAEKLVADAV